MATETTGKTRRRARSAKIRVVVTNAVFGQICRRSLRRLPAKLRERVELQEFSGWENVALPQARARSTVLICRLADLPQEAAKRPWKSAGLWRHIVFLERLPVEAMAARLLQLNIRNPQRLHVATERHPEQVAEMVYRLFSGAAQAEGSQSIVDAWVEADKLVLLSHSFERLVVPLEDLSQFIGTDPEPVRKFEIDEDGRFLFWPHADVHLGWEQLLQITDPSAAVAAMQRSRAFNVRYGVAVREFREEQGLKQSDFRDLTERHLRRVEHGEQRASAGTLEALAAGHGMSLNEYLQRVAERL